jgi:putative transposase
VVSADQRRQAVRWLQESYGVSQRRACALLGQPRATQRQAPPIPPEGEERLVERMLALVRQRPRFGYRRIWVLLRREGWRVNRKKIYRLWRQQGLKVPKKQRKKRRLGRGENGCVRQRPEYKDHVWAWDFFHDRTSDGRPLKWLTLLDEYTRECLALEVRRSLTAQAVKEVLTEVVRQRGAPRHIRSDNGPEFIAGVLRSWLAEEKIGALYIEPGAPWQNGYAESFNGKVEDELVKGEEFASVLEARVLAKEWKTDYNEVRPHSSLRYRTPAEFAASCPQADSGARRRPADTTVTKVSTLTAPGT